MLTRINMKIENSGQRKEVWFLFRTDHPDMAALHAALVKDGSLCGERLETRRLDAGDGRMITDAYEVIIMRENITSVSEPMENVYAEDGEAIWTLEGGEVAA